MREQNGQVVIQAEHYDGQISRSGKSWVLRTDHAGYSGNGAMVAEPDTGSLINTGYTTVEYLSAAIIDMELHTIANPDGFDADKFERETLAKINAPAAP